MKVYQTPMSRQTKHKNQFLTKSTNPLLKRYHLTNQLQNLLCPSKLTDRKAKRVEDSRPMNPTQNQAGLCKFQAHPNDLEFEKFLLRPQWPVHFPSR